MQVAKHRAYSGIREYETRVLLAISIERLIDNWRMRCGEI